jgi:hypothetical protein
LFGLKTVYECFNTDKDSSRLAARLLTVMLCSIDFISRIKDAENQLYAHIYAISTTIYPQIESQVKK